MNLDPATPAANRRTTTVVVLTLIAAAVLAALWLWRAHGDDVAPASGEVDPVAATGVVDATTPSASVASPAADVQREEVGAARITGVVLDAAGAPVAGASVVVGPTELPQPEPEVKPLLPLGPGAGDPFARLMAKRGASKTMGKPMAIITTSAADGTFVLAPVDAGHWRVHATLGTTVSRDIDVALGQKVDVELRFAATEAIVMGEVRATGIDRALLFAELKTARFQYPVPLSPDGWYRTFGAVGPCTVRVHQYVTTAQGVRRVVIAERGIVLAAGGPPVRCDFDVGAARIDVAIEDPSGMSTNDLVLTASGPRSISGDPIELRSSVVGGRGTFEGVPCGAWQIGVTGPSILPRSTESVEVSLARPNALVVLRVQRAGLVRVRARDLAGQTVLVLGTRLQLGTAQGILEGTDIGRIERGRGVAEDFAFAGVPLGRAELICEDRDVEGRRLFLPFDPLPRQAVEVVAGDGNRVELRVERRALVQLRAVDRVGREDRTARIAVFAAEREVAAAADSRASFWRAHLPTGDYRILVERPGASREHGLQVGRQNLEWKLRP